ncbi:MAG: hypothetical protein ACI4HN_10655 [Ruminococcus sp.]
MSKEKNNKTLTEKITNAYIRRIKKWMFCPSCRNGKLVINKKSTMWQCEDCGYQLSAVDFEDDYVFWFCDECGTYLNNQEGFDRTASKHICTKCGYENDTTFDNIKGVCVDCGKTISDPEQTLCTDCKIVRQGKAKERLKTVAKVVGAVAAIVGVTYLASQATDDDTTDTGDEVLRGEDDSNFDKKFDYVNSSWLDTASEDDLRATSREMENLLDELDYNSDEHTKIYNIHIDVVNAIASRFPLNLPHREHGWYLPNDD